jgi:hypothetical protein
LTHTTATTISDALYSIQDGLEVLQQYDTEGNLTLACGILRTLGSMTDKYPIEYFTDEELDLITEATIESIHTVRTYTEGEL